MSTREQVIQLRQEHPDWTKVQIARAVKPPVAPQRVGQIENGTKRNFQSEEYRAYNRHRYHKKVNKKYKRKNCKYCIEANITS